MSPIELSRQIGQLLIAGFHGAEMPVELRSLAQEFGLGGVILMARNIGEPEQVADLCHTAARVTSDVPPWVSIDQEGGRVARLKEPFTRWPVMATLGRSGDVSLARRFARALATELRAVGITLDYAPILDIHTNPMNPVIGDRALGDRADDVAEIGAAIIRVLQEEGVAACGKHFPGHGDTSVDSHIELPLIEHSPDRLRAVEFVPFRAAIEAGVATLMTAHVLVPALDELLPATLSHDIVADILRNELGFQGVVFSDDLEMKAITSRWSVPESAVMAVRAGCDGVLICSADYEVQAATLEALVHAVEEERLPRARVEEALRRQVHAKERYLSPRRSVRPSGPGTLSKVIGCDSHQAIAEEMARFL